ncbi:hypothetical protein G4G28_14420 [Massilia sp. Dwa41.01b]|uniref:hypothetical protein n=1 Tax=unclassified Massilia TaxID=2609279 RepID=UPI00160164EC|nr:MULTISPECIES: hypothetical protein [unclassified Massilia]QNA89374.1 hypothetical protein G4G28_14420 [Massilia sp. Dwa41.01b]QNB00269.1 hypothetical protein G4G31_17995 [Massilia sp. Se16.2.3]
MNREDGAGNAAWASAMVRPWLRLADQLTPMIGESGFCALFGRALRTAGPSVQALARCSSARPLADLFASLTNVLNETGPEEAARANDALLGTFTTLLGTLIGEALTKQLLHIALVSADGRKHGQEQK